MAKRKHEWCDVFCEKCDSAWGVCIREGDSAALVMSQMRKVHADNHPDCHVRFGADHVRLCLPEGRCPQIERMKAKVSNG